MAELGEGARCSCSRLCCCGSTVSIACTTLGTQAELMQQNIQKSAEGRAVWVYREVQSRARRRSLLQHSRAAARAAELSDWVVERSWVQLRRVQDSSGKSHRFALSISLQS